MERSALPMALVAVLDTRGTETTTPEHLDGTVLPAIVWEPGDAIDGSTLHLTQPRGSSFAVAEARALPRPGSGGSGTTSPAARQGDELNVAGADRPGL